MSLCFGIMHSPTGGPDRDKCLQEMLFELGGPLGDPSARVFDQERPLWMPWSRFKCELALMQWEWALETGASHCVFLTDDLYMAPGVVEVVQAMVDAKPDAIIGLLSNSPRGPELAKAGHKWYRCNSWVVGPAYVVPRRHLAHFVEWYKSIPDTEDPYCRRWFNDDSSLNHWNTFHTDAPHESWHPLPTPIEHRVDIESTVGHGDRYSRERVSWRAYRDIGDDGERLHWKSEMAYFHVDDMKHSEYWDCDGPMVSVGEGT